MKAVTFVLAGFLNVAPLAARVVNSVSILPKSPAAILLKWAFGALAVAGSHHAVSAASAVLASPTSISGKVGSRLSYQIKISDGSTRTPESWVVNGQTFGKSGSTTTGFPPGLSLSLGTGIISGTPTQPGVFEVAITAYEKKRLSGASLAFTLTFTLSGGTSAPPQITAQPVGGSVPEGGSFSLTVVASGSGTLQYQWRHDGAAIPGASSATLSIGAASSADAGTYTVLISNSAGTTVSAPASLAVTPATGGPAITSSPADATLHTGEPLRLTVTASGGESLTYRWERNGVAMAGASEPALILNSVSVEDAGSYTVVVTGSGGSVTSAPATVIIVPLAMEVTSLDPGSLQLALRTVPGRQYIVQAADQALGAVWETVGAITASGSSTTLVQAQAAHTSRFWRYAVSQ